MAMLIERPTICGIIKSIGVQYHFFEQNLIYYAVTQESVSLFGHFLSQIRMRAVYHCIKKNLYLGSRALASRLICLF
jgi:hypothetical protein